MVDHTYLFSNAVRQDQGDRRARRAGRPVLRRQRPDQPRPVPARRQRDLGPGPARPVDRRPRPRLRRPEHLGLGLRPRRPEHRGHRVRQRGLRRPDDGQLPRQLAVPGEGPADDLRRLEEEPDLQRAEHRPSRSRSTTAGSSSARAPRSAPQLLVSYRSGDVWSPHIEPGEALQAVVTHFAECIRDGQDADQRRPAGAAGGPAPGVGDAKHPGPGRAGRTRGRGPAAGGPAAGPVDRGLTGAHVRKS